MNRLQICIHLTGVTHVMEVKVTTDNSLKCSEISSDECSNARGSPAKKVIALTGCCQVKAESRYFEPGQEHGRVNP